MFGRVLTSNLSRVLGTLLVIGVAGSTVTYGTFATFTAQTSNTGNTFSTGSLVLGNRTQMTSGSTCLSTGAGSASEVLANAKNCDTVITAGSGAGLAPGGSVVTGQVGIYNSGSLPINTLKLFADACGTTDNTAVAAGQRGIGDACGKVNVSVFNFTAGTCLVPSAGSCTNGSAPPTATTLQNFPATSAGGFTAATNLAAGAVQTYTFAIQLDSTAGNSLMGRQATTTFHWYAE
jgi:hypothetical protein